MSLVCVWPAVILKVQAHMEHCSLMFVFQCCFGADISAVLSGLKQLFSSIPPPPPPLLFSILATDLLSVDGCLE